MHIPNNLNISIMILLILAETTKHEQPCVLEVLLLSRVNTTNHSTMTSIIRASEMLKLFMKVKWSLKPYLGFLIKVTMYETNQTAMNVIYRYNF